MIGVASFFNHGCFRPRVLQCAPSCPADHRVKNGDLSPSQAVQDFMSTFDFGVQQPHAQQQDGGFVSQRDFMEYYTSVSPTIEDDNVFTLMVWNSWLSSRR